MSAEYVEIEKICHDPQGLAANQIMGIRTRLDETIQNTNGRLRELIKSGYYNRVSITFRCQVYEAILFFQATHEDLATVASALESRDVHCYSEVLSQIARTAGNLNTSLRFTWKTDSYPDDYSEQRFLMLSQVYRELATMFETLGTLERLAGLMEMAEE